jgi:hypothetical protein
MDSLGEWDYAILAVSVYVAITMLVRLMSQRRDRLIEELSRRAAEEKRQRDLQDPPADRSLARHPASRREAA